MVYRIRRIQETFFNDLWRDQAMVFFLFVVPRTAEFCKKASQRRRVLGNTIQRSSSLQQQTTVDCRGYSLQFQQQIKQDHAAETRSIEGHYQ